MEVLTSLHESVQDELLLLVAIYAGAIGFPGLTTFGLIAIELLSLFSGSGSHDCEKNKWKELEAS